MYILQKQFKAILLIVGLLALPYHAFAAMVGFDMDTYNVSPGETISVSIFVSDFAGINISGGGVVLDRTNPMLISANSVTINAPNGFGDGILVPSIDNGLGRIDEIAFTDFKGVDGNNTASFSLATIAFTAGNSLGSSILSLTEFGLNPFSGNDIASNDPILSIPLEFSNATVNVIPIPPAVWLLGSGLIGLVGISKRKK